MSDRRVLRGPARPGRAQGAAGSSKRGTCIVLREQGARSCRDADYGRRHRRRRRAHRGLRVAATPTCGSTCVNVFATSSALPLAESRSTCSGKARRSASRSSCSGRRTSTPRRTGPWRSGQDSESYAAGLVSAAVNLHYGHGSVFPNDDPAFEDEYAPYGVDSGLCWAWPRSLPGEGVTLQPCGVSARTVWVVDAVDRSSLPHRSVRGSADQRLGHQFLAPVRADLPGQRFPDRHAAAAAEVTNLTGFSRVLAVHSKHMANSNQLWGATFGVLK